MDIHIHHHIHCDKTLENLLRAVVINNNLNFEKIMTTLKDIQDRTAKLAGIVQAEGTVITSAVELINGFGGIMADIRKQLADAIAANDPAAFQAVADTLDTTMADMEAKKQALADAVAAGTPAAHTV